MASTSKEGEIEAVDAVSIPSDLDNSRILELQIQLMKEQDEELEKLAETIRNTTHLAWGINEEFRLLEGLSLDVNKYVEVPNTRVQRVQRKLTVLDKRRRGGHCTCCHLLLVTGIIVIVAVIFILIKYLL